MSSKGTGSVVRQSVTFPKRRLRWYSGQSSAERIPSGISRASSSGSWASSLRPVAGSTSNTLPTAMAALSAWSVTIGIASPSWTIARGQTPSADFTATRRGAEAAIPG